MDGQGAADPRGPTHMSQGRSTPCIGDGRPPTFNDGILISWGPINPYGLGLMSLSPMEMSWELIDPIAHMVN